MSGTSVSVRTSLSKSALAMTILGGLTGSEDSGLVGLMPAATSLLEDGGGGGSCASTGLLATGWASTGGVLGVAAEKSDFLRLPMDEATLVDTLVGVVGAAEREVEAVMPPPARLESPMPGAAAALLLWLLLMWWCCCSRLGCRDLGRARQ